jgi:hypothetical protein
MIKNGKLCCPVCNDVWLHQSTVDVYINLAADRPSDTGIHVTVLGNTPVEVDTDISKSPSSRRNGLRIGFECETCGPVAPLAIYQHKGETFIKWETK